jgi:hypothetical protein
MLKIGIIVGSTRPGRKAAAVAKWVHDILKTRKDAEFEIVDIEDYKLPLLDEPVPPRAHQYGKPHTKTWSEKIASLDAYIFVTPRIQPWHLGGVEERDRFSLLRMEQQSGGIRRIWRRRRGPSRGELEAGHGRNRDCGRASTGGAFDVYRLRELHDL